MKTIPLTKGLKSIVDEDKYSDLIKHKWFALSNGKYGHRAARQISVGNKKQKCIMMHRQLINAKDGEIVDHINRNTLDNRRENLRIVTSSQSNMNRKTSHGSSKYKGVYRKKWSTGFKWGSQIKMEGKYKHIGYYDNEEEAAKAYDSTAKQIAGDYACLNFPKEAIDMAYSLLPNKS